MSGWQPHRRSALERWETLRNDGIAIEERATAKNSEVELKRRIGKMRRSDGHWAITQGCLMILTIGIGWLSIGCFVASVLSSPDFDGNTPLDIAHFENELQDIEWNLQNPFFWKVAKEKFLSLFHA